MHWCPCSHLSNLEGLGLRTSLLSVTLRLCAGYHYNERELEERIKAGSILTDHRSCGRDYGALKFSRVKYAERFAV